MKDINRVGNDGSPSSVFPLGECEGMALIVISFSIFIITVSMPSTIYNNAIFMIWSQL